VLATEDASPYVQNIDAEIHRGWNHESATAVACELSDFVGAPILPA